MATTPARAPHEHMKRGLEHMHKTHKAAQAEAERLAAERAAERAAAERDGQGPAQGA